jgi:uncharacterized protein (TIGR03437 family)
MGRQADSPVGFTFIWLLVAAVSLLTALPRSAWAQSPPAAPNVLGVVNNSTFRGGPLAPGSIAAVFGTNLNDGSTVRFSSFGLGGKLVTSLGGSSVKINDIPAPLFYSTRLQLGVQIPFELSGQSTAIIQVTVGSQTSAPFTIALDAFVPILFESTRDQGGGPSEAAAVFHEDGFTPVTFESPARRNEVIEVFLTGLGTLNPPLSTGAPSAGNRTPTTPLITFGGNPAEVLFSGGAPGFVGLDQINVRIPPAEATGTGGTLVVNIGGRQSTTVSIGVSP